MDNMKLIFCFRNAGDSNIEHWILNNYELPHNRALEIRCSKTYPNIQKSNMCDLYLYSYYECIAARVRCKPDDCTDCPKRFKCVPERMFYRTKDVDDKDSFSGARYLVTNPDFVKRTVKYKKDLQGISKHLRLVLDCMNPYTDSEIQVIKNEGLFLHPSTIHPLYKVVDCWADNAKY